MTTPEAVYLATCAALAALGALLTWWGWRGRVPKHRLIERKTL